MSFPSQFKRDASGSVGLQFIKVYNAWHARVKAALETLSITHPQFVMLAVLGYLEQFHPHISQKMLADFSDMDVMTTSQVIKLLEKKGLIQRNIHPSDSRAKSIRLLAEGKNILHQALPMVEKIDLLFFGILAEEESHFQTMLEKLLEVHTGAK